MNGQLRPVERDDIPALVDLHRSVHGCEIEKQSRPLADHFEQIFFDHPWYDASMPSLCWESESGKLAGCLGVMPRPMQLNGESIKAAVCHNYMVAEEARGSMAALQMSREFLRGSHDLALSEGNNLSRKIWHYSRGFDSIAYSLCWLRPIRPARYLLTCMERRGLNRSVGTLLRGPCSFVDRFVPGYLGKGRSDQAIEMHEAPLEPAQLGECFKLPRQRGLLPLYNSDTTEWLLNALSQREDCGELHARILTSEKGITGWYIYYAKKADVGNVVQIGAAPGHEESVLRALFTHADAQGVAAVRGHVDPQMFPALGRLDCLFHHDGESWVLVHSRRPDVVRVIQECRAFLSPLEGEWWINFIYG